MNKSDERERCDSGLVYLVEEMQRDLESALGGLAMLAFADEPGLTGVTYLITL